MPTTHNYDVHWIPATAHVVYPHPPRYTTVSATTRVEAARKVRHQHPRGYVHVTAVEPTLLGEDGEAEDTTPIQTPGLKHHHSPLRSNWRTS